MKKLIIHIGHAKTGTSYIQYLLAKNNSFLKKIGYVYPVYQNSGNLEGGLISSGNGEILLNSNFVLENNTIFSSELLFYSLSNEKTLEKKVLIHNSQLTIILYTRNVFEMICSLWGQLVKRNGYTDDINTFMLNLGKDLNKSDDKSVAKSYFENILFWLKASKKYKFKLILRNYSDHKNDLIQDFLKCILKDKMKLIKKDFDFKMPYHNVNRSLTESEYFLQQEFNKHLNNSSNFISDTLVENLPNIKSEIPYINFKAYKNVKNHFEDLVYKINKQIGSKKFLQIESYRYLKSISNKEELDTFTFTNKQIETLVKSISDELNINTFDRFKNKIKKKFKFFVKLKNFFTF